MGVRPRISLIVVSYQSAALAEVLLGQIGSGPDEVIVVDSGSPSDSEDLEHLGRAHPEAQVVRLSRNVGYGTAANEGARRASGDVIVVANADVTITAEGVRELARAVGGNGVALAAPRFVDPRGSLERSAHRRDIGLLSTVYSFCGPFAHVARRFMPDWHPTLYSTGDHERQLDCVHVLGALMAIDAKTFRVVGGFDEGFFLYREETDLCVRIRATGRRVVHVGSVTATHIGGASSAGSWPYQGRTDSLTSHYRYLRKHRGRPRAALIRATGTVACAIWFIAGPADKRALARRALRWHLGLPVTSP